MKYFLGSKRVLIIFFIFFIACNRPCPPPAKPDKVPFQAEWFGGCDGGHWIQLVDDSNKYHFRIFRDWDGTLLMDALFKPDANVNIDLNNWKKDIYTYGVNSSNDTLVCIYYSLNDSLIPLSAQYPAFGGEDWDLIKEKYHIK